MGGLGGRLRVRFRRSFGRRQVGAKRRQGHHFLYRVFGKFRLKAVKGPLLGRVELFNLQRCKPLTRGLGLAPGIFPSRKAQASRIGAVAVGVARNQALQAREGFFRAPLGQRDAGELLQCIVGQRTLRVLLEKRLQRA